ncbi:MAG: hypothetical protein KGQ59_03030 [Bdellovibrionales bacterium]|nr:hypothetical protein [Bdellovibrionales bacterium]
MREYPWLERQVSWSHLRVFSGILDRVNLVRAWCSATSQNFESFLDYRTDQSSQDAAAWLRAFSGPAEQSRFVEWCGSEIGGRTPEEALCLFGITSRQLEQRFAQCTVAKDELASISRRMGYQSRSQLPKPVGFNLLSCALALHQSGFGWLDWPSPGQPLLERDTSARLDWVLLACPHRDQMIGNLEVADFLCSQHNEWFRGFLESIDSRLRIHECPPDPISGYCRLSLEWSEGK